MRYYFGRMNRYRRVVARVSSTWGGDMITDFGTFSTLQVDLYTDRTEGWLKNCKIWISKLKGYCYFCDYERKKCVISYRITQTLLLVIFWVKHNFKFYASVLHELKYVTLHPIFNVLSPYFHSEISDRKKNNILQSAPNNCNQLVACFVSNTFY